MNDETTTNEQTVCADIPDWHKPRNEDCPHNTNASHGCTCKRMVGFGPRKTRKIRTRWLIRVSDSTAYLHGVKNRFVVELRADGMLRIRESGRRAIYETTIGKTYSRLATTHAVQIALAKKRERAEKRAARHRNKKARRA